MEIKQMTFEEIVEQYQPLVLRIINSLCIYKERDVYLQIGLVALWEAQKRYNPDMGAFSTFAYITIKGRLQTYLTKETTYYDRHQGVKKESYFDIVDERSSILLDEDILEIYCSELSDNQRKWVKGKIIEDKTSKEIALEQGVSLEKVKSWRREAVKKLRKTMVNTLC